jgi:hypothetical protein
LESFDGIFIIKVIDKHPDGIGPWGRHVRVIFIPGDGKGDGIGGIYGVVGEGDSAYMNIDDVEKSCTMINPFCPSRFHPAAKRLHRPLGLSPCRVSVFTALRAFTALAASSIFT